METRAPYVIVGVFVLTMVFALAGFITWYASREDTQEFWRYVIYFRESVAGLDVGSNVRYRGIRVGTVEKIQIDPDNVEQAKVLIRVDKHTPVRTDTKAALKYQGITGVAFIELKGGTQSAPPLECPPDQDFAVIPAETSQFERIFENAPDLVNNFNKVGMRLADALNEENLAAINQSLAHIEAITATVANNKEAIAQLITQSAEVGRNLNQASKNLALLSESLRNTVEENRGPIQHFTSQSLPEAERMFRELNRMSNEIEALSAELRENPSQVLFGPNEQGVKLP